MKKKVLIILAVLSITLTFSPITVLASPDTSAFKTSSDDNQNGIQPIGNVTGYIYRMINGKEYKRLWSYTYNRWEDPYWTLA